MSYNSCLPFSNFCYYSGILLSKTPYWEAHYSSEFSGALHSLEYGFQSESDKP